MKAILVVGLLSSMLFGQVLYEEYFTGGAMQLDWHPWFTDTLGLGDSMQVISDPTTPGGDDWAGRISNEYMGVAGLTYAGESDLTDYAVEAWIYTVVIPDMGPYNGIAIRLDPATRYYYRLVSDFDSDARLRLGLVAGGGYPIALRDWTDGEIPGGVPSSSSWHKFEMKLIADSIWCYYDDVELPDCPIINDSVTQGYFGVYTFNMLDTASTKCDNIIAFYPTGVAEHGNEQVSRFQAYPNPFSKLTTISFSMERGAKSVELEIYDVAGRLVKDLSCPKHGALSPVHVVWDGRDEKGAAVAPGVYFIVNENEEALIKAVKLR